MPTNDPQTNPRFFYMWIGALATTTDNLKYVLAADQTSGKARLEKCTGALRQLWYRETDPVSNREYIINVDSGLLLDWSAGEGADVKLAPRDISSPKQVWWLKEWGDERVVYAENYLALGAVPPCGPRSNVGQWKSDGNTPHQRWKLTDDVAEISVSISYSMKDAKRSGEVAPTAGDALLIDNTEGTGPVKSTRTITWRVETQRQFTFAQGSEETLAFTRKLGTKLSIDKLVEFSSSAEVKESRTKTVNMTDLTGETVVKSDELQIELDVPPGRKYEYVMYAQRGKVTVPYTATVTRTLPDKSQEKRTVSGEFRNTDMVRLDLIVRDVTSGTPQKVGMIEGIHPAVPSHT